MLAKILEDMWVDPDVLDALSEEQKRILFVKMREEQVRRWRAREEEEQRSAQSYCSPADSKVKSKQVSWLLGRDGDVSVVVIGETDEFRGCKLLRDINNRLLEDHLNNIQTRRSPGHQARDPGLKEEEEALSSDDYPLSLSSSGSPPSSSEDDMDLKEMDSSDSDSGCSSDTPADWAPPLYRTHPCLHGNRTETTTERGEGAGGPQERELTSHEVRSTSGGGRVAELRRAFAHESAPSCPKPPVPNKPPHLQRPTAPCIH